MYLAIDVRAGMGTQVQATTSGGHSLTTCLYKEVGQSCTLVLEQFLDNPGLQSVQWVRVGSWGGGGVVEWGLEGGGGDFLDTVTPRVLPWAPCPPVADMGSASLLGHRPSWCVVCRAVDSESENLYLGLFSSLDRTEAIG